MRAHPRSTARTKKHARAHSHQCDTFPPSLALILSSASQTNPAELLVNSSILPIVTSHGPYVYREYRIKYNFTYGSDENGAETLAFKQWRYWEYQPSMSGAGLDPKVDVYTTVNFAYHAILHAFEQVIVFGAVNALQFKWSDIQKACGATYPTDFGQ
jgi:hypothetical protein